MTSIYFLSSGYMFIDGHDVRYGGLCSISTCSLLCRQVKRVCPGFVRAGDATRIYCSIRVRRRPGHRHPDRNDPGIQRASALCCVRALSLGDVCIRPPGDTSSSATIPAKVSRTCVSPVFVQTLWFMEPGRNHCGQIQACIYDNGMTGNPHLNNSRKCHRNVSEM